MKRGGLVLLLFCCGLALCTSGVLPATAETPLATDVAALTASGTIQARELRLASEVGGRILEVHRPVGSQVRQGETLVTLDGTPLLLQLSLAEAAVATAQADLAQIKAGPRVEEIAAARALLALAEAERDGALAGWLNAKEAVDNPQELDAQLAQARAQLALAEQGVELARAQLEAEKLLRDQRQGIERQAADLTVQAATDALAAAEADRASAQQLLNWLWVIRQEPLGLIAQANVAVGRYDIAQAGVVVAKAQLDDLLSGPTAEEVAVANAAVRQAEAEANVLRVQLDLLTLQSSQDGVILAQVLRAGELAAPAATILTLADLDQLQLVVYVPENRVGEVILDGAVAVTVDSFPGRSFAGAVIAIGDEPEFTPRNVATAEARLNTFYAVEIALPNPGGVLKPGMPADATFR